MKSSGDLLGGWKELRVTEGPPSCLPEGVQLLCLIDKAADACRYLQTYGEWNRAAWLAKVGHPVGALSVWDRKVSLELFDS